jgi:hypothetical protein
MTAMKLLKSALAIFLGLSACTAAKISGKEEMPKAEIQKGFSLTIEQDKEDPDASNVFVDGLVGTHPYRFILDTGGALTSLKDDKYLSSFKTIGKKDSSGAFEKYQEDLIEVPSISVGSLTKHNLTITRTASNLASRHNLLGMNFLKDYALHFRYDLKRVDVIGESEPTKAGLLDLFIGERGHPYVDIIWNDTIRAKGVWDSGAGITVFDLAFMKKHPELFRKAGSTKGTDSSGSQMDTPLYELKGFELGKNKFPAIKVVVIDLSKPNSTIKTPMDFVLGNNVITKANWFFDFPRKKWAITEMHSGERSDHE